MKPGILPVHKYLFRLVSGGLLILSLSLILAACKANPTVQPTVPPIAPADESPTEPIPTSTLTPTAPLVSEQRKVVLLGTQAQAGEIPYEGIQSLLQNLAEKDNLMFEAVSSLEPVDLTDQLVLVVVLPPDPGIAGLASSGPDIQFLAIGIPELQPAGNLSVIGGDTVNSDMRGFVAGYLAAVVSEQWRVGMIGTTDLEQGQKARQGFINGVTYYCGLCRSPYPPFYTYPILVDLPSAASPVEAQAAAETIISQAVNTVFVYPAAGDQAMLETLTQAGVAIIGSSQPSPSLSENWVATVQADHLSAVKEIWPELLAGRGGLERSLAISLIDRNERLFSPGRQHLLDEFLADLQAGFIDTGVTGSAP